MEQEEEALFKLYKIKGYDVPVKAPKKPVETAFF